MHANERRVISIRAILTILCWLLLISLTVFVIILENVGLIIGMIFFWAILITDMARIAYDKQKEDNNQVTK
jgi:hypothetical protein